MREIKGDLNKGDTLCSWIKRLSIVEMPAPPKFISRFNAFSIKITAGFFGEIDRLILIVIWKSKGPRLAKTTLIKNNIVGLTLPDFETYRIAI